MILACSLIGNAGQSRQNHLLVGTVLLTRPRFITSMAAAQSLNQAQKDAVLAPLNCASLCVAGPGSGKTKVLTTRIAHLIKNHKQSANSILAITFTNKASKEMKARLNSILGDGASGVTIGTFHSFGSRLLRTAGENHLQTVLGSNGDNINENFTIWDQDDCLKLTKDLMEAADISDTIVKPSAVMQSINNIREARAMSMSAAAAKGEYKDALSTQSRANRAALSLIELYEQKLHQSNALDFQDLLLQCYALLRLPEVQAQINKRYRHVLVDEYQDTNVPQYEIVRLLSPQQLLTEAARSAESDASKDPENASIPPRSLFCVGDQNQAIYSWRGARMGNMDSLKEDYPAIRNYGLLENYRCSPAVTSVANAILGTLATTPRQGSTEKRFEPVRLITTEDDDEQARCIATLIKTLETKPTSGTASGSTPMVKEVAIMYRTNAQSRILEQVLVQKGVKYVLLGGRKFYDRKEIRDLLSFLRILMNPFDRIACTRAMEECGVGIGPKTLGSFFAWLDASAEKGRVKGSAGPTVLTHFEALVEKNTEGSIMAASNMVADPPIEFTKREQKSLLAFAEQILSVQKTGLSSGLPVLVEEIMNVFVTPEYLLKVSKSQDEAKDRLENVNELLKASQKFGIVNGGCISNGQLALFLEEAALLSGDDGTPTGDELTAAGKRLDDVVYLMTIHASKGLEFDTVFLTGMEEGSLPLTRSAEDSFIARNPEDDSEAVLEERRLAFVAVTRAKSLLFITCRKKSQRIVYGSGFKTSPCETSRFIAPLSKLETVVKLKWKPTE